METAHLMRFLFSRRRKKKRNAAAASIFLHIIHYFVAKKENVFIACEKGYKMLSRH